MTTKRIQRKPYPLGAHKEEEGIRFAFISRKKHCGILLFDKHTGKRTEKIPFCEEERTGNIHIKHIPGIDADNILYQFYEEDKAVPDPFARAFIGGARYGQSREEKELKAYLPNREFDWGEDKNPRIPYEECIAYCMHVRGFTKHKSSGVANRGTFAGMTEKLSYLKELGITTVELQPAYEFLEEEKTEKRQESALSQAPTVIEAAPPSLNYWGYKKGYYYAPKAGYAADKEPGWEFKEMIKAFHKEGLEIVMQFYFPPKFPRQEIQEILRFWVLEYHVDGFHLIGENLTQNLLAADPLLSDTKLWYHDFDVQDIDMEQPEGKRHLLIYRDDYMYDMRRFLKGDENMLKSVLYHMRHNPEAMGRMNYFTNYHGFTMMDLVSYERKHNEENGEEGRDGNEYNFSWNCGAEGSSRKQKVNSLRKKQIKNAMCMLFFSQATPLIFMGDEFGNSQKGNNNPYCQDSALTWLTWGDLDKNKEIYDFTAALIRLRKEHPILRREKEMRIMDYLSCGYPDLSYHGEEAWRPSLEYYNRHIGLMYCGKYCGKHSEDAFFYVAINMHWEAHEFAMPKLPKGKEWEFLLGTDVLPVVEQEKEENSKEWQMRKVPGRSVAVFISRIKKPGRRPASMGKA